MKYSFLIVAAVSAVLFVSCKKEKAADAVDPAVCYFSCTTTDIDSALSQPKGSYIYQIDAYNYQGALVHLYYYGCCDRYNKVKDANCNFLFAPSGGVGGGGDGTHPNFFKEAVFVTTVWKDPR
ncbi:DUF6970 domain-containing protein [Ferruginibacter sp.]